ncbi:MAG: cupredoxin domain-containing protein [Chloroflexi bacterium]|nr:cupredoxin domain-containing protein [Chloroflexota bacterium]
MNRMRSGLLLLVVLLVAALPLGVACAKAESGETMEKPGGTMEKTGETMAKPDDVMTKGDSMAKEGDSMAKEGDAMAKDGSTEKSGDSMAKEGDAMMAKEGDAMMTKVPDKIVAPHFVDSVPNHGDVLPQAPNSIVLSFNFNLHADSSLAVTRDGQPVTLGTRIVSANQLTMSAPVTGGTGDGVYTVTYKACWPDRSCHEGSVSFVVDSAKAGSFENMRGRSQVAIAMKDITFSPQRIVVSAGTKVTWTNDDEVVHFVNTDPHPSHNGLAALNSSALEKGQSYAFTFDKSGIYGYHCSAHTNMTGQVLVEG